MQSHEPSAAQIVFGCYVSLLKLHIFFIFPNLSTLQPDTFMGVRIYIDARFQGRDLREQVYVSLIVLGYAKSFFRFIRR